MSRRKAKKQREPLLTKHGRIILILAGAGFAFMAWGRASGFSNSGLGALCVVFVMSIVSGLTRFIAERHRSIPEAEHSAWPDQQWPPLPLQLAPPAPSGHEGPRLLSVPREDPSPRH